MARPTYEKRITQAEMLRALRDYAAALACDECGAGDAPTRLAQASRHLRELADRMMFRAQYLVVERQAGLTEE